MQSNLIEMNADIIANGTVYANGPVIVQGVDVKLELEKLQDELTGLDQKYEKRVDDVFYFVLNHYETKEEDRSKIRNVLKSLETITDWGGRLQFIQSVLKTIDPVLSIMIVQLIKYADVIKIPVE